MALTKIPVMLDIETLGTNLGDVILSIAAYPFHLPYKIEPFYMKINVDSSLNLGFTTMQSTIDWWGTQPTEVFDEATSGVISINEVLTKLSEWVKGLPGEMELYGNSNTFDNEMVKTAYNKCNIEVPWSYRQDRDYRTLFNLFKGKVARVKPSTAHNALSDAEAQGLQCSAILDYIENSLLPEPLVDHIIKLVESKMINEISLSDDQISTNNVLDSIINELKQLGK